MADALQTAAVELDGSAIVRTATPSVLPAGGIVPRRRFQKGALVIRGKRNPQRCGMYREDVFRNGTVHRLQRMVRLGPVSKLSERAAWAKFQPYLDRVNSTVKMPPKSGVTLEVFIEEWRTSVSVNLKPSTVRAAESHLRTHILPNLGRLTLPELNTRLMQSFVTTLANVGLSRKTIENVLLTLSSILRTARAWEYECSSFSLSDITMPREGPKKEQRCFSAQEVGQIIAGAREPFKTMFSLVGILGLRVGEALALRVCDLDFEQKIIRVRQSVDSDTRVIQAAKSEASTADLPMPPALEARLRSFLTAPATESGLLFVNRNGRPYSANKLREKVLHPLLKQLGIPHGGFHAARHGVASEMFESGATPAVVQKQLRHSDARITLGIYGHVVGEAQRKAVEMHERRIEKWKQ
jgi:integrase